MEQHVLSLKVMLFNAENLFLLSDKTLTSDDLLKTEPQWQSLSTSLFENKPLAKLFAIQKLIEETQPDLIALCEVGGLESLNNFNRLFLAEGYFPLLLEGNSNRNIDIGFLLKKNYPYYFDLISNKNRNLKLELPTEKAPEKGYKFSRDVAELHLFKTRRDQPFFVFLLTHLKSRLDPNHVDPNGFLRRQAEVKELLQIYKETQHRFSSSIPTIVAGDFNGMAQKLSPDTEFAPLYTDSDLLDVCELAGLPVQSRATFYQFQRHGRVDGRQIDFAFLSSAAQKFLLKESVQVYRYKDELGLPAEPPMTLDGKYKFPSDHYPLVFSLIDIPVVD